MRQRIFLRRWAAPLVPPHLLWSTLALPRFGSLLACVRSAFSGARAYTLAPRLRISVPLLLVHGATMQRHSDIHAHASAIRRSAHPKPKAPPTQPCRRRDAAASKNRI